MSRRKGRGCNIAYYGRDTLCLCVVGRSFILSVSFLFYVYSLSCSSNKQKFYVNTSVTFLCLCLTFPVFSLSIGKINWHWSRGESTTGRPTRFSSNILIPFYTHTETDEASSFYPGVEFLNFFTRIVFFSIFFSENLP